MNIYSCTLCIENNSKQEGQEVVGSLWERIPYGGMKARAFTSIKGASTPEGTKLTILTIEPDPKITLPITILYVDTSQ